MVDESHSAGVVGKTGRGVSEFFETYGRVDLYTGTLGKAFGGAVGGFTTGRQEIIDMLRQRSRPYLFSNSIPPSVVGAGIETFKILDESKRNSRPPRGERGILPYEDDGSRLRHQTDPKRHLRGDAL